MRISSAIALAVLSLCALGTSAKAQYVPEWDTQRPPADPTRPAEYRTADTDEWIRLTPYAGMFVFANDLDLEGGLSNSDWAGMGGLRLEFDPADLMLISIDVGLAAAVDRFFEGGGIRSLNDIDGTTFHVGVYVGLKNPEIRLGPVQPILGMGLGVFGFVDYDDEDLIVEVAPGQLAAVTPFEDTFAFHGTLFFRLDVDVADHVKFGADVKVHMPFYVIGDQLGEIEEEDFVFSRSFLIIEPTIYFSIAF